MRHNFRAGKRACAGRASSFSASIQCWSIRMRRRSREHRPSAINRLLILTLNQPTGLSPIGVRSRVLRASRSGADESARSATELLPGLAGSQKGRTALAASGR